MNRARLSHVSHPMLSLRSSFATTMARTRDGLSASLAAIGLACVLACATLASAGLVGCTPQPKPAHRLVGTWEFSPERTRALSRDEREQFESPEFAAMKLRFGGDGYFAFEGVALSKGVPQASRYELAGEEGANVTIRVTRPDKPEPETMKFEFFGADELRLLGDRRLAFQRVP